MRSTPTRLTNSLRRTRLWEREERRKKEEKKKEKGNLLTTFFFCLCDLFFFLFSFSFLFSYLDSLSWWACTLPFCSTSPQSFFFFPPFFFFNVFSALLFQSMSTLVLSVYQNTFSFSCVCVCVCVLFLFLVFVARLSKIANKHSLLVLCAPYFFFFI